MQRKSLFWVLLSLLCLGGAFYFWHLGDQWQAERAAAHQAAAANSTAKPSVTPHAFAPGVGSSATSQNAAIKATAKNPYPYRLSNTDEPLDRLIHNEKAILLANALLDTGKPLALAAIPDRLKAPANSGTYIVQARGALTDQFRAALRDANATIISYIPNNAYLVRVSDSGAQQLSAQAQSVLPYEPYYKLDAPLLKLAMEQPAELPPNGVKVTVFADAYQTTRAALDQMGAIIVAEDRSPFGPVLAVEPAEGTLSAVASLPGVQLVAGLHKRVHANDLARPTLGAATDSLTTGNYLGLTGNNVLLNINDDGVDQNHPDLTGRLTSDFAFNLTDLSGHGTHVAGTIMGSGFASTNVTPVPPGSATNAGSATAGPFVFRGLANNATAFVMSKDEPDAYLQENAARTNAFISNNSWNYANDASYDIAAASYDAAVRDALPEATGSQAVLFVFAAGGNGGAADNGTSGDADTILSPATAKNVITVGAVEQLRRITNTAVGVNGTNSPFLGDTDSNDQVAAFSSRGNVGVSVEGTAGRFKPDLVAPGTYVISDRSTTWDTQAYYNPTNEVDTFLPNRNVTTNALNFLPPIFLESNFVSIVVTVLTNRFSPNPFPAVPIYAVVNGNNVNPTTNNFVGTNVVTFPTGSVGLIPFDSLRVAIGNVSNPPVNFDVLIQIFSTNDTGFFVALSNLNNSLDTNGTPPYRYESGTSMAAAGVSGMLACMQEFFQTHKFLTFSPALMKAMLINGANSLDDYDLQVNTGLNSQGWGVPSLTNSLPIALAGLTADNRNTMPILFVDQSPTNALATGQSNVYNVGLTSDGQNQDLRITLVWTDPPGNPVAGTKLVNDLDLIVSNTVTGDVFYGNDIPSGSIYNSLGDTNSPNIDSVNNVENVFLQEPIDTNFVITVLARRVNVNAVTANTTGIVQDYALVISSVANPGQPGITNAFTNFTTVQAVSPAVVPVTNIFVVTNAVPLFNQRVGGNSAFAGSTNGTAAQWNFYVYTNTAILTNNTFTNIAFVTFSPPSLAVPRMEASGEIVSPDPGVTRFAGADVDLYVSANPALTNLDPAAIATALVSATRTGTEKILITNGPATNPSGIYYLAVKSEDQQGAQYDLLASAINEPFDQTDSQGNVTVTMLTPFPIIIPPGGPSNPGHALILGVSSSTATVRKVVVTNVVTHQEFGDLIGTFTHESAKPQSDVLNNHSFFPNNNLTNGLVYDDAGDNETPGAKTSDGPGSLRNFTGDKAADGIWRFVMVNDNSLTTTGAVLNFVIKLEPQPPQNGFTVTIPPNSFFYDFVDVPADATNLTISVAPQQNDALDLYLREGDFPTQSLFDFFTPIPAGGGSLTVDKFSSPPLNADRYFFGIYNPNAVPVTVFVVVEIGISLSPEGPAVFTSVGNEPLLDDAVNYSTNKVNAPGLVVNAEVGVRIEHPRESDLVLTLISPEGTRVLLAENRGGLDTNGYGAGLNITNVLPLTAAGTVAADTNVISLTNNFGTLLISYDFFQIPDDMRVYYDGVRILDSGLVSGTGTFSVDFGPGNSTNIEILMNEPGTNPNTNGDMWTYTASVITKNVTYAVFSENTNLATVPIKFAVPPFGGGLPFISGSNVMKSSFEGVAAGDYGPGSTVDGWTVLASNNVSPSATNVVKVVTVPQLADTGTNVLALHRGAITRLLPTVAGRRYTLTFANHGRPSLKPVSWWKAEDNGLDSADGNDGMLESGLSFTSGEVGQAFSFNGTSQWLLVADAPNLRFTKALTLEAWIEPTQFGSFHSIIGKWDGVTLNQLAYSFALNQAGVPYIILSSTGQEAGGPSGVAQGPVSVPLNQWTHLAGTYDGTNLVLYANGVLQASSVFTNGIFPSSDNLAIGANGGGENAGLSVAGGIPAPFQGLIDEPTVYSNALSIKQVQDIYAAGSAGKCPIDGSCVLTATVLLGNETNTITGLDRWTQNSYTFVAPTNGMVLTIIPDTNGDGTVQDGMLVDSFNLAQIPSANPTNFYLPEESLDKITGERAQGDWRLEVLDSRAGATNPSPSLVSWQLSLQLSDAIPFSIPLQHALPQTNEVPGNGGVVYYEVNVPQWALFATNSLIVTSGGPLSLVFNQIAPPATNQGNIILLGNTLAGTNTLSTSTFPQLVPGQTYFLAVSNGNPTAAAFVIEVDFDITTLTNNIPATNTIGANDIPKYYQFDVLSNSVAAVFQMLRPNGNVAMVVQKGPPLPDLMNFNYATAGSNSESITVLTNTLPVPVGPGRWYVGVFNNDINPVTYTVEASQAGPPTIIILTNDERLNFSSGPGPALTNFFEFSITNTNSAALFELYNLSGNVDLTLQREALPYGQPFFGFSGNGGRTNEQIVIRTNVLGTNINGNWFLGVPNNTNFLVTYTIHAVVATNGLLQSQVPIQPMITIPPVGSPFGPTLTIPTVQGEMYQIQTAPSPVGPWTTIATITASGDFTTFTAPVPTGNTFYRVIQIPSP